MAVSESRVKQVLLELLFKGPNSLLSRNGILDFIPKSNARGCDKARAMLGRLFGGSKFGRISGVMGMEVTVSIEKIVEDIW